MAERGTRDIWFEGVFMRVQVSTEETEGRVSVMEQLAPANWSPPTHVHSKEDQVLYILEGEITAQLGGPDGPTTLVKAGESVFLPRQVPHCFLTGPEGAMTVTDVADDNTGYGTSVSIYSSWNRS